MKRRLILACLTTTDVIARAKADFDAVVVEGPSDMTVDEVTKAAAEHKAEAILFTNTLPLNAVAIAALPPSVKVGATSSVGYDHVDVAAAKARGLIVTNTPGVLDECTADFGMMLMLAAARRGAEYDRIMRKGWRYRIGQGDLLGVRVTGKRVGILGMGRIGRAFAQRARGFDMKIMYHARTRLPPELEQGAEYFADLHAMLPHCDFLSIHAPGGPATDKMVGAQALSLLPDGAVLVNAARGTVIDEDALYDALTSGKLFAAGLDVFRSEPDFDLRFAALENVVLAPHVGSASKETRDAMGYRALDNIAAVLDGRPAIDPLWRD
ncbi:MAG TPA: D-glycerate dehydrogenase [Acetobacteraceae bacterium]|jgi:lactate dehydrogenase-like 2-hydroxyacid dehydrogenase|nr:D-glycerate dehydrogenase [Acetobacteraceae bacterium]